MANSTPGGFSLDRLQSDRVATCLLDAVAAVGSRRRAIAAFPARTARCAFERDNEIFLMNPDGSGAAPLTSDGIAKQRPRGLR